MGDSVKQPRATRTFLGRLARDARGNTLAMMAIALIPMSALAGSAVDMARLYVVKVRLQQACDAGVLAGRKFMDDSNTSATLDDTAKTRANDFFGNNFKQGWMNTSAVTFTPSKTSDNQVNGVANATVPMTIMKMFKAPDVPVSVTCKARFDVADTDVLFVLDTTGSMACLPGGADSCTGTYTYTRPGTSGGVAGYAGTTAVATTEITSGGSNASRIEALRQAVLSFYDTFAANADPSTHIRYGFVTYASSVNAGKAIMDVMPSAMVGSQSGDTASYESRKITNDYTVDNGSWTNVSKTTSQCNALIDAGSVRDPVAARTYDTSTGTATNTTYRLNNNGNCQQKIDILGPKYTYRQYDWDVSSVVAGNTVTNPTKVRGQRMSWLGCVETNVETPGQTSFSAASPPPEINPNANLSPTSLTRWIPQMQDLAYERNNDFRDRSAETINGDSGTGGTNAGFGWDPYATKPKNRQLISADGDLLKNGSVACGKPVKRLGVMSRDDVVNFVKATDFVPMGGTYHDTGMIWGARLISPSGLWANDTAAWPNRNTPNRVIVFMTDGHMAPNTDSYSMYGIEGYDQRVANGDDASQSALAVYHNARFLAACAAAKSKNIDIWTVAIDDAASSTLQSCSTTTAQSLYTTTGSGLADAFATIARRLAMLRITQ